MHCLKFWKTREQVVFWSVIRELRLENDVIGRKLIGVILTAAAECFALLPALSKLDCCNINVC
jgi:hypothetical protein